MARLEWDQSTDRTFEDGLDRGVLYPLNGPGVAWNGLIKVDEKHTGGTLTPMYYEGEKFDLTSDPNDLAVTVTAYTYPDVLDSLIGSFVDRFGIEYDGTKGSDFFSLAYRTMVNDDGDYKLHVLFNLKATPVNVTRNTLTDRVNPIQFAWDMEGVPERIMGMSVTRVIFDTRRTDSDLLRTLEEKLYGTEMRDSNFVEFLEYLG